MKESPLDQNQNSHDAPVISPSGSKPPKTNPLPTPPSSQGRDRIATASDPAVTGGGVSSNLAIPLAPNRSAAGKHKSFKKQHDRHGKRKVPASLDANISPGLSKLLRKAEGGNGTKKKKPPGPPPRCVTHSAVKIARAQLNSRWRGLNVRRHQRNYRPAKKPPRPSNPEPMRHSPKKKKPMSVVLKAKPGVPMQSRDSERSASTSSQDFIGAAGARGKQGPPASVSVSLTPESGSEVEVKPASPPAALAPPATPAPPAALTPPALPGLPAVPASNGEKDLVLQTPGPAAEATAQTLPVVSAPPLPAPATTTATITAATATATASAAPAADAPSLSPATRPAPPTPPSLPPPSSQAGIAPLPPPLPQPSPRCVCLCDPRQSDSNINLHAYAVTARTARTRGRRGTLWRNQTSHRGEWDSCRISKRQRRTGSSSTWQILLLVASPSLPRQI